MEKTSGRFRQEKYAAGRIIKRLTAAKMPDWIRNFLVKMTRPQYGKNGRGEVHRRKNDEFVYVTFKFPKKYGRALIMSLYQEEADQIMSYLKTRKEETVW